MFARIAKLTMLCLPFAFLVACGGGDTEGQVDRGNQNLRRMDEINQKLLVTYGFDNLRSNDASTMSVGSQQRAAEVRALLNEYIQRGEETQRISGRSDVRFNGHRQLGEMLRIARENRAALDGMAPLVQDGGRRRDPVHPPGRLEEPPQRRDRFRDKNR